MVNRTEVTALDTGTIPAVLRFPNAWPPGREISVFSRTDGTSVVTLTADTRGRLGLHVHHAAAERQACVFQPVTISNDGRAILIAGWSPSRLSLRLNGHELLPDAEGVAPFVLALSAPKQPPSLPDSFDARIDPEKARDEPERLFLGTLSDIQEKLARGKCYDLITAAGRLRLLLLDDTPLVHRVNRNTRLPISFTVVDYTTPPPVVPDHAWQNLDPSRFPGARTITIDLKALLAAPCLTTNGVTASVKDLIRACANAKGGVHLGRAGTPEEKAVLDWDQAVQLAGQEPSAVAIAGLCRVVLHGLRPLAAAMMG